MNADSILIMYFTLVSKRRKVKRSELASRARVNVRTVSRAIDALTLAGVPVYSETGPDGGYFIPDDYIIANAAFSAEEKARIINCIHATRNNFDDDLCDAALDKLNSLTQPNENYLLMSDVLVIDASDWNSPSYASAKISMLGKAATERKTVRMQYVDKYESSSDRYCDPYNIVQKGGKWYLYAYCHTRKDFRLFKIARIQNAVVTDNTFERKPSNVYEKLRGDFNREDLVRFTIEFSNFVLPEIEEWLGADAIEDIGRCYRAEAEMFGGSQLIGKLMSFGSSVKVTEPAALREEIEIECARMLDVYK